MKNLVSIRTLTIIVHLYALISQSTLVSSTVDRNIAILSKHYPLVFCESIQCNRTQLLGTNNPPPVNRQVQPTTVNLQLSNMFPMQFHGDNIFITGNSLATDYQTSLSDRRKTKWNIKLYRKYESITVESYEPNMPPCECTQKFFSVPNHEQNNHVVQYLPFRWYDETIPESCTLIDIRTVSNVNDAKYQCQDDNLSSVTKKASNISNQHRVAHSSTAKDKTWHPRLMRQKGGSWIDDSDMLMGKIVNQNIPQSLWEQIQSIPSEYAIGIVAACVAMLLCVIICVKTVILNTCKKIGGKSINDQDIEKEYHSNLGNKQRNTAPGDNANGSNNLAASQEGLETGLQSPLISVVSSNSNENLKRKSNNGKRVTFDDENVQVFVQEKHLQPDSLASSQTSQTSQDVSQVSQTPQLSKVHENMPAVIEEQPEKQECHEQKEQETNHESSPEFIVIKQEPASTIQHGNKSPPQIQLNPKPKQQLKPRRRDTIANKSKKKKVEQSRMDAFEAKSRPSAFGKLWNSFFMGSSNNINNSKPKSLSKTSAVPKASKIVNNGNGNNIGKSKSKVISSIKGTKSNSIKIKAKKPQANKQRQALLASIRQNGPNLKKPNSRKKTINKQSKPKKLQSKRKGKPKSPPKKNNVISNRNNVRHARNSGSIASISAQRKSKSVHRPARLNFLDSIKGGVVLKDASKRQLVAPKLSNDCSLEESIRMTIERRRTFVADDQNSEVSASVDWNA